MSYGLHLWRQTGVQTLTWDELWTAFEEGQALPFVEPLRYDELVPPLRRYFPAIEASPHEINWEGDGSYFQINPTYQTERDISSLQFSCGFSLPTNTLERFFDYAFELKLTVYDGQGPSVHYPIGSKCRPANLWDRLTRRKWDAQRG